MNRPRNEPVQAVKARRDAALTRLASGHGFTVPDNLFNKISDEDRESWSARFAGTRA